MAKRKTDFSLDSDSNFPGAKATITQYGVSNVSVKFETKDKVVGWLEGKPLEHFALNILKALKSKHLKK